MNIPYTGNGEKERLDVFLTKHLPQFSRSRVQKLIDARDITVNGKAVPVHYFLRDGDAIECSDEAIAGKPTPPPASPMADIPVIFENDDIVIIDKPSGMLVHATPKNEPHTVVAWAIKHYPEIAQVGDAPSYRPGIVHRLDKDVSGLLMIAKHHEAYAYYKDLFRNRTIEKNYIALVHGVMPEHHGVLEGYMDRSSEKGKMIIRPVSQPTGKYAKLDYVVTHQYEHFALLSIRLHTGRTHQIRVQFSAMNHPLAGDQLYHQKKTKAGLDVPRIFLHAAEMRFIDRDGETHHLTIPLPRELAEALSSLKK